MDKRVKLSTLWILVMFNMVFADIYLIMVELVNRNTLDIPGDVRTIMAIAAVVTNIPIIMIFLSRMLKYKANRISNIIAGVLTIIYVIGGGDKAPHYIVAASIEVIILIVIIVISVRWKNIEN